jgi:hypothetical protein
MKNLELVKMRCSEGVSFKPLKIKNGTFSILLGQIPLTFLNDTPTGCAILNVQRYNLLMVSEQRRIYIKTKNIYINI